MTVYAFPSGHNPQRGRQEDGMTLKDYFAAKAMQTMISIYGNEDNLMLAKIAYSIADAMMKARDE